MGFPRVVTLAFQNRAREAVLDQTTLHGVPNPEDFATIRGPQLQLLAHEEFYVPERDTGLLKRTSHDHCFSSAFHQGAIQGGHRNPRAESRLSLASCKRQTRDSVRIREASHEFTLPGHQLQPLPGQTALRHNKAFEILPQRPVIRKTFNLLDTWQNGIYHPQSPVNRILFRQQSFLMYHCIPETWNARSRERNRLAKRENGIGRADFLRPERADGVLERADGVLSELMGKKRPSERVKDQKLP